MVNSTSESQEEGGSKKGPETECNDVWKKFHNI